MKFPNGYGSVIKLGGNRRKQWAVRLTVGYDLNDRQKFKYIGYYEKRTEALAALVEYNKNPYDISKRKITFEDLYREWSEKKYEQVSHASKINYNSAYNKCTSLYKMPFIDIKTAHLQAVIDEYKASASVRLVKVIVGQLYDYAIKNDIVEKDYSQFIELPKKEKKKDKTPFTNGEIKTLWKNKDYIYADMILILLYTGMRISELLEMKIENINIAERYMVGGLKTEAGKNRIIPIHKDIECLIKNQIQKGKEYLFETVTGKKHLYGNVGTKINGTIKHFKMDHTIHETRHTFISQASRLEINQTIIKRIVGHSTKDITEHYTHKNNEDLIQAIDLFYYK